MDSDDALLNVAEFVIEQVSVDYIQLSSLLNLMKRSCEVRCHIKSRNNLLIVIFQVSSYEDAGDDDEPKYMMNSPLIRELVR